MKYSMRCAVYEEMIAALKRPPRGVEDMLLHASYNLKVESIAPFYGYYLYPHEWLHQSLESDSSLLAELNVAMAIALDAPTLEADPKMSLYFSLIASRAKQNVCEHSLPVAFKTTMLFQKYVYLHHKVSLLAEDHSFTIRKYRKFLKNAASQN